MGVHGSIKTHGGLFNCQTEKLGEISKDNNISVKGKGKSCSPFIWGQIVEEQVFCMLGPNHIMLVLQWRPSRLGYGIQTDQQWHNSMLARKVLFEK